MTIINKITLGLILSFLFVSLSSHGQDQEDVLTFYDDIQPIIHMHCTPCHQPGRSGPFNLITYEDVAKRADFISYVTAINYMPPWQADPTYQTFLNERIVPEEELEKLYTWIAEGMVEGVEKKSNHSSPVSFGPNPHRKPDASFSMTKPFDIPGDQTEEFRFFNIPTNLPEDTYVEAIEFIPGNKRYVHHSRIMADTTNEIRGIDGLSETDPKVYDYQTKPLSDEFMYGWVPGNFPVFYPPGTGKKLYANTDIILNMHYAPSSLDTTDQSIINFYFNKEEVDREVYTLGLVERHIVDKFFLIKANTRPSFKIEYQVDTDMSLISVQPHMHYLGQSFHAYAITPDSTEIPLIKIPKWDFNWQTTYQFKSLVKVPAGSTIIAHASFDNTMSNPLNPYIPPRDVTYGWGTKDEMMNLIFYYINHKEGDEDIDLVKLRKEKFESGRPTGDQ